MPLILGIESSCDDLAAAVVRDGREILSSVVQSQDAVHAPYGGVVPELASRDHVRYLHVTVERALVRAAVSLEELDGIGVTSGPCLVGSLLVGLAFAQSRPRACTAGPQQFRARESCARDRCTYGRRAGGACTAYRF